MVLPPPPLVKQAILKTLAYADVFDFPLTVAEVRRFLISPQRFSLTKINQVMSQFPCQEGFYFLPGRQKVVLARKGKWVWNRQKMRLARRFAGRLKMIPTIKMVAVTGAVAMENAGKNDDIDILIVSQVGTLWITRLFVVLLAELVARRRRPHDQQVKDKICLNMFLDETYLALPVKERNLYTAHEVVQMRLLWDRGETYQKFIQKNVWVKKYLANADDTPILRYTDTPGKKGNVPSIGVSVYRCIESLSFRLQRAYMSSRQTVEVVESGRIRFHPHDCTAWVLKEYQKRISKSQK